MAQDSPARGGRNSAAGSARARIFSALVVAILFLFMAVRQHRFVDRYAVNVMFYDAFDFYRPFTGATPWEDFDHQHGPHRMGLGLLLGRQVAKWSHFNSRWDAFAVSFLLIAACALALPLARLCGVRHPLAPLPIPLIFLNRSQFEQFLAGSDTSPAAMPIFLFMLFCLSWFIRADWMRLALIVLLTFVLIFTGYGMIVGIVALMVLLVEQVQAIRSRNAPHAALVATALLLIGLSWILFLHGYDFGRATAGTQLGNQAIAQNVSLFAGILAHNFAVRGGTQVILGFGMLAGGLLLALCVHHAHRIIRGGVTRQRTSVVIFCLAGFALIYTVDVAIGRAFRGWRGAASTSRYVTLLIPAGFALYLHLATGKNRPAALLLPLALAAWLSYGAIALNRNEWAEVNHFHNRLIAWRAAYFSLHDEIKADAAAHFLIYPTPGAATEPLHYLEQHHLNMFYRPHERRSEPTSVDSAD